MNNTTKVSLAVTNALGRLGIAHDVMEMEPTEKVRPWQEGLVRLALRQGKNLTTEEREVLEGFLEEQGGKKMEKHFWGWQWAYGFGCHQQLCDGTLIPCGILLSFNSKKERDEWAEGYWREKKSRGEAMKLLRRGWTGNSAFDEEVGRRKMDGETPLSDKELLELWKQTED